MIERLKRLLVVLRPDSFACEEFNGHCRYLTLRYGLCGRSLQATPYHLSIMGSLEYHSVPRGLVDRVNKAASSLAEKIAPFEITLDEVMSFWGDESQHALVAVPARRIPALHQLFHDFQIELHGTVEIKSIVPHVTLMYEKRLVFHRLSKPVRWMAGKIDVVIRHFGNDVYEEVGSYYFRG